MNQTQRQKAMHRHTMLGLTISIILLNTISLLFCFIFPPIPYFILSFIILSMVLIITVQMRKRIILVGSLSKHAAIVLLILVLWVVFYLVCGLTTLVYLDEIQRHRGNLNPNLSPLLWENQSLSFTVLIIFNLFHYFGNCILFSLYARAFYRMFWVENIVFIYRYLREQVTVLNANLMSNLTIIEATPEIQQNLCPLCLEQFKTVDQVARLSCHHCFHKDCIRLWILKSSFCPLCRQRVVY